MFPCWIISLFYILLPIGEYQQNSVEQVQELRAEVKLITTKTTWKRQG